MGNDQITVEKTLPAEPGIGYPRCLTGRCACPPEDCGGIDGFSTLLEAVEDPDHSDHGYAQERFGHGDAAGFDLQRINTRLAELAAHLAAPD